MMLVKWYCISCGGKGAVGIEGYTHSGLGVDSIRQDHDRFRSECSVSKDQLLVLVGEGQWVCLSSIEKKGKEIEMRRRGET